MLAATGATAADAVTAPKANSSKSKSATPDRLRYDVTLRGNADGSHWTGHQRVTFRNASDRPLHEVYVRLWGNGDDKCGTPGKPSPIRLTKVSGGTAGQLSVNCTALRISLPKPLARGERTAVGPWTPPAPTPSTSRRASASRRRPGT
ncbi:hypothetical protein ACWD4T_35170, partial [Streptomyces umbrinus]